MENSIKELQGLSIAQAAKRSSIGRTKLYEAISCGELVTHRYGKRRIVLLSDLRDWLTALPIDCNKGKSSTSALGE